MTYPHEVQDVHQKHHTYSREEGYQNAEYVHQEYPKTMNGVGPNEGRVFSAKDEREEQNVKEGREPEQDAPAAEPEPEKAA